MSGVGGGQTETVDLKISDAAGNVTSRLQSPSVYELVAVKNKNTNREGRGRKKKRKKERKGGKRRGKSDGRKKRLSKIEKMRRMNEGQKERERK